jgi:GNAT superfamily N-acetyltransferase
MTLLLRLPHASENSFTSDSWRELNDRFYRTGTGILSWIRHKNYREYGPENHLLPLSMLQLILLYLLWLNAVTPFLFTTQNGWSIHHLTCRYKTNRQPCRIRQIKPIFLIPVRSFQDEITFLSTSDQYRYSIDQNGVLHNTTYELSLMEESDIPNVAQFIVRIFGGDAINLSQNLTTIERIIMSPAVDVVNGYSSLVAFAEVVTGLRARSAHRLQSNRCMDLSPPSIHGLSREEQLRKVSSTSVVLVLGTNNDNKGANKESIIASVELRLQPCDAKIPFTLPCIDRIERKLFSAKVQHDIQPYLSNLCVDETYRGRGIGKTMIRCVENIAQSLWGYKKMYLHVDLDNEAALMLYKNEGYKDVGRRWNPFWAGKAADIGYFVKTLSSEFDETTMAH